VRDFDASYVAGHILEVPDESAEDCFERACICVENTFTQDVDAAFQHTECAGSKPDSIVISSELEGVTLYAMPVWLLHCVWEGKDMLVAVSGIADLGDAACVGDFPICPKQRFKTLAKQLPSVLLPALPCSIIVGSLLGFTGLVLASYVSETIGYLLMNPLVAYLITCLCFIGLFDRYFRLKMSTTKEVSHADWRYDTEGFVVERFA